MSNLGGTFQLGTRTVHRLGFGAMRLAGPKFFGPPADPAEAAAVLRHAIEAGVNHIDTAAFYGPDTVNQLIRETLHPYRDGLTLVTKVGAARTPDGGWLPAYSPAEIRTAIEDNLRHLGLDTLDVVNLRMSIGRNLPAEGSLEAPFTALLELQREGKIRHLGLSNITAAQLAQAQALGPIVCVQNGYSLVNRADDELLELCANGNIAFVPFFPMGGGMRPLRGKALEEIAAELNTTKHQVALAWLLTCPDNVLLIPGTGKLAHVKENLAATTLALSEDHLQRLEA